MTDGTTSGRALSLESIGMTKAFGRFTALDNCSIKIRPGTLHALLGENGAGKSTLVKCIMGFYTPTSGDLLIDGREHAVKHPRDAMALGIGMVYQHFTLVPSLTVEENLVISHPNCSAVIDWARERSRLADFLERMPFKVRLASAVANLSAGEKQKLEILKQLYLDRRFLILDEPTSVLTPNEADEVLGHLKAMTTRQELTILMITHKFREVSAYADEVSVLRRGKYVGGGLVGDMSTAEMARLMIGDAVLPQRAGRQKISGSRPGIEINAVSARDDDGMPAVSDINLSVGRGEIVGIAGVSGNGQAELVEVLSGQRRQTSGSIAISGQPFLPDRASMARLKVFSLQEEPLRNSAVPTMSVAENIALRDFDTEPLTRHGVWLSKRAIRAKARALIERYRIKTQSPDAAISTLSGGNVQRTVLARELSGDVDVLIAANPCFGLDFASVTEIRDQIMAQRNRGAAVLLVSEDLDEVLELADRVVVMSDGRITLEVPTERADRTSVGHAMAGGHA
jgi:general nucleoside transport system ATP-binding protein